ncbi:hypothetical protein OCGS_2160 [Oceaniovalibus guishaninsula JLT2003]|uniref:Glycosyltransferase 2-like domain-containing protein n=1 Tax=Oceaniovalibus guishaninsula JLT2003 TaxID=1231392 RepID=K2GM68_9RHOB|nr:glycosyltransferase family 2 protein [Oceaniovalibus guishaninsula]EKE43826.1 hypothetical protein OCGS_2160 [Oceaniovalibus guishaninsula JLT2003]
MTLIVTILAMTALVLAGLYAVVTLVNLAIFATPRRVADGDGAAVSILIPARDEAANIDAALDAVLAQQGIGLDVVVLDDGSSDDTAARVAVRAARDPRVRLVRGAGLPPGWNGKQHACHQLARHARHPVLLFVDADVRLAPDAALRMWRYMEDRALDLVSGFPRQITRTLPEIVVIPQIFVVLLGYLPLPMARTSGSSGFAAGCGQLMMVRADAYRRAGGHAAFRDRMHDGLNLPRNVRLSGGRTDILDATPIASCRMYDNWPAIRQGFTKNATEGMARPVALPVWTVLLGGGHVLPFLLLPVAWAGGTGLWPVGLALALLMAARTALAVKVRQHPLSVLLHPLGVIVTIWIQWAAFIGAQRGRQAVWRGRAYDVS